MLNNSEAHNRIDWVDHAKGICIILVVMMHSTLGVEKALGATQVLGPFIEWARPFRMPDFFLISGLFLSRRMAAPWRSFADTKIVHFAYFYVLWMTIQFLLKGPGLYQAQGLGGLAQNFALGFIEPFGTLWFIYLLAVMFAVARICQALPRLAVFFCAAVLEMLPIHTGSVLIDEFAARFVYFYAGFWLAPFVFACAAKISTANSLKVATGLGLWAALESYAVFGGYSTWPGVGLLLGFLGAAAVMVIAVLLSRLPQARVLRHLGANSIVIYLAFFLFMATARIILVRAAPGLGADVIAALVTLAGICGPLLLHRAVRNSWAKWLFVRPAWARVETWAKGWHNTGHDHAPPHSQPQAR